MNTFRAALQRTAAADMRRIALRQPLAPTLARVQRMTTSTSPAAETKAPLRKRIWARLFGPGSAFRRAMADYQYVLHEVGESIQARPLRAAGRVGLMGLAIGAYNVNPDGQQFKARLVEAHTDMMLLQENQRRREAWEHVDWLTELQSTQRLRFVNCVLFTVVMTAEHSPALSSFEATFWTLHAWAKALPARFIDVGFNSRFVVLERKLVDFDIPDDDDGFDDEQMVSLFGGRLVRDQS